MAGFWSEWVALTELRSVWVRGDDFQNIPLDCSEQFSGRVVFECFRSLYGKSLDLRNQAFKLSSEQRMGEQPPAVHYHLNQCLVSQVLIGRNGYAIGEGIDSTR